MSTLIEKEIREILEQENRDRVNKAAADLLRALLLLYGSAWESELGDMLMSIWSIRGLSLDQVGELQSVLRDAEEMLSEKGIIKVELRYRGDLGESEPTMERLYSTSHLYVLMKALSGDRDVDKVRLQIQR